MGLSMLEKRNHSWLVTVLFAVTCLGPFGQGVHASTFGNPQEAAAFKGGAGFHYEARRSSSGLQLYTLSQRTSREGRADRAGMVVSAANGAVDSAAGEAEKTSKAESSTSGSDGDIGETTLNPDPPVFSGIPRAKKVRGELPTYWYAALASGTAGLLVKAAGAVVGFIPAIVSLSLLTAGVGPGPAAFAVTMVAAITLGLVIDSALSSLVGGLVYDFASDFYESNYVAAFAGHLAGNAFALGAPLLTGGMAIMLTSGVAVLQDFAVAGALEGITAMTILAAPPVVFASLVVWMAVPALIGSWAIVNTARPAEGFVLDPSWKPLRSSLLDSVSPSQSSATQRFSNSYLTIGFALPGS